MGGRRGGREGGGREGEGGGSLWEGGVKYDSRRRSGKRPPMGDPLQEYFQIYLIGAFQDNLYTYAGSG